MAMDLGTITAIGRLAQIAASMPEKPKLKDKWQLKDQYLLVMACLREEKRQKHITEEEYIDQKQKATKLYKGKDNDDT